MGNRISWKKAKPHGSVQAAAAPTPRSAAPVNSGLPADGLRARKDEGSAEKQEVGLPVPAFQAPVTARDGDGNEEDPLDFFRHCYALEGDPFTLYTQALLLKNQREFAAARYSSTYPSELLRSLLSNASLALEARHHLAQCLIAQDPALNWCRDEATQCLEGVVAATTASSNNAEAHHAIMYRESLELLIHMLIADRHFDRALQLLETLQSEIDSTAMSRSNSVAHRQQQTLVRFQRAFCRYARGDSPDAVSSELLHVLPPKLDKEQQHPIETEQEEEEEEEEEEETLAPEALDPLEGIEILLHADAASLREGLALLAATSS